YLVQINVEAVDARYCDDLKTFTEVLKKKSGGVLVPTTFSEKTGGWVVEVRGYTYHYHKGNFIQAAFLENLARRGAPDGANPPERATGPVTNRVSNFVLYQVKSSEEPGDIRPLGVSGNSQLSTALAAAAAASAATTTTQGPGGREGMRPTTT